jgi:hypothetical protein
VVSSPPQEQKVVGSNPRQGVRSWKVLQFHYLICIVIVLIGENERPLKKYLRKKTKLILQSDLFN